MWRTDPRATLTNQEALGAKILEKGWKSLTAAEKAKALSEAGAEKLQEILPEETGYALLALAGQKRNRPPKPKSLGKVALIKKIKAAFKKKRRSKRATKNLTARSKLSGPRKQHTV